MFWLFVVKEFKSIIRDPKLLIAMVVVPLILIAVLYFIIGQGIVHQIEQTTRESSIVAVFDTDGEDYSQVFVSYLNSLGLKTIIINCTSIDEAIEIFKGLETKILYIIPPGFSYNLSSLRPSVVQVYVKLGSLTIGEGGVIDIASRYINLFNSYVIKTVASEKGISPEFIGGAIVSTTRGLLVDRVIDNPSNTVFALTMGGLFIPLIILMLVIFSAQLISTSMAIEKEEKMFETLLSLPIKRMSIIGAKLLVSIAISAIYMIGYSFVLFGFIFRSVPGFESLQGIPLAISLPSDIGIYILLNVAGLAMFMVSVALLLSLFAEDVRSAQAILGNVIGPTIIAVYLPMFIDISSSPSIRLALSFIPLANTIFIPKIAIVQDIPALAIASISNLVYGVVMFMVIRRIVSSETIFTLRLSAGRKKAMR
ncbi:MAG: ABC transporter permease [Ignisphaera sp.]|uniref:ABC transporter permease n=1 Tax=Ignisphaera aggregans TaxID=334771 RepID=A0A7J3MZ13_9CREN